MPPARSQQEKDHAGELARTQAAAQAAQAERAARLQAERGWVPDDQLEALADDDLRREAAYRGVEPKSGWNRSKLTAACRAARIKEQER